MRDNNYSNSELLHQAAEGCTFEFLEVRHGSQDHWVHDKLLVLQVTPLHMERKGLVMEGPGNVATIEVPESWPVINFITVC